MSNNFMKITDTCKQEHRKNRTYIDIIIRLNHAKYQYCNAEGLKLDKRILRYSLVCFERKLQIMTKVCRGNHAQVSKPDE